MTSQVTASVVTSRNGSMNVEVGSGSSNISEAWIPFQPAIEEPSKKWPDSNLSGPKALTGTLTCCSLPRVSVKRRSTNLTSLSLINWNVSFGVIFCPRNRIVFLLSPRQKKQPTLSHKKSPRFQKLEPKTSLSAV